MPQAANRKGFHRTEIGSLEKLIGGSIIVLLIGIGIGIFVKGHRYDPTQYTGKVEALDSTREAVEGKAATLRGEVDLRANESARFSDLSDAASGPVITTRVDSLVPMGDTEFYTPDTLFEKINGRAPAYFEYGFVDLTSRSFSVEDRDGEFVDVFLFRMSSPLNAFGIFSSERDASSPALDFAVDGYNSGSGLFARQGDIYLQVIASSTDPLTLDSAEALTRELVSELPADESGMGGRSLLPIEDQVPGSLTYINENAYGQAALSGVFEARYLTENGELTCFAQECPDAETARTNWETLRTFYEKYGNIEETFTENDAEGFAAEVFGQWSVFYTRGNAVGGVVNAAGIEPAMDFVAAQLGENAGTSAYDDYAY